MKITEKEDFKTELLYKVEISKEEFAKQLAKERQKESLKLKIPGFRKGKIPNSILDQYVDEEHLFEKALNGLLPHVIEETIVGGEETVTYLPKVEVTQKEPNVLLELKFAKKPEVTLPEVEDIEINFSEKVELTEDEVNAFLKNWQVQQTKWNEIEQAQTSHEKDLVLIDVVAKSDEELLFEKFNQNYLLVKGRTDPLKGFAEKLMAQTKDSTLDFKLAYTIDSPLGDNDNKQGQLLLPNKKPNTEIEYQDGEEINFSVKITSIYRQNLPPLSDDVVSKLFQRKVTLEEAKKELRASIEKSKNEHVQQNQLNQLVDRLIEQSVVEVSDILVEYEAAEIRKRLAKRLNKTGMSFEDYLKKLGITKEKLVEKELDEARARVIKGIILDNLVTQLKIEVSDEEVKKALLSRQQSGVNKSNRRKVRPNKNETENLKINTKISIERQKAVTVLLDKVLHLK